MENKKNKHLNIPITRKSVMILNEKRKKMFDETFDPLLSPCATSTVEKQGYKSLTGILPQNILLLNNQDDMAFASYESSLGILDIDKIKELEDDSLKTSDIKFSDGVKSLSFNPQEISARSTNLLSPNQNKENFNPNKLSLSPNLAEASNEVEAIIDKARMQSNMIDNILKFNNETPVKNLRTSLQSFKESIWNDDKNKKDVWNQHTKDLGFSFNEKNSSIRDSMFRAKVNMSEEEMLWIKEHADLPIDLEKLLSDSKILDKNSLTLNDNSLSNPFSDSKVSVGNYFVQRSDDINHILRASSPKKKIPYPPLYETTYVKQVNKPKQNIDNHVSPHTQTDFVKNDHETPSSTLTQKNDLIISTSSNSDDTLTSNLLSLTQIKNFVGKLDTESPSMLIDHMLGANKKPLKKIIDDKNTTQKKYESNMKNSFGNTTNIFHSTETDDFKNVIDRPETDIHHLVNSNPSKLSPVSKLVKSDNSSIPTVLPNDSITSQKNSKYCKTSNECAFSLSNSQELSNNHNSVKSTETTDNSMKSATTVIHVKKQSDKCHDIKSEFENILSDSYIKKPLTDIIEKPTMMIKNNLECPLIKDKSFQSPLTYSDASREIKDIMSPSSVNSIEFGTPESGRYVKRLLDHFPPSNSHDRDGWISPRQTRINNTSKECVISKTPFKNDKSLIDTENINYSGSEYSVNVPIKGDWVEINSNEQDIVIGILHNLNLKVDSLGSRWVSLAISIKEIFVNNKLFLNDTSEIITIQDPIPNILLNANTKTECMIQITCWVPNQDLRVIFDVKLVDIVTKSTTNLNHCVKIHTCLPKISVESLKCKKVNNLEFPIIPNESEACIPLIIWNESEIDFLMKLDVTNSVMDAFNIIDTKIVPRKDFEKSLEFYIQTQSLTHIKKPLLQNVENLPRNKQAALIVLILFKAPKIDDDEIRMLNGILNISLMPKNLDRQTINIQKISILGKVGSFSLLIRSNQKSNTIVVNQGSTETIEMFNAGSTPMNYKLYFMNKDDQNISKNSFCEQNVFTLNKNDIFLDSGEKTTITISFPICDIPCEIKRSLVFENPYTSETLDIIGVSNLSRCQSQQSAYSVESVASLTHEIFLKCTKKELSWGSLKIGDSKTQDITFKNTSATKKIRVLATVVGEGFKLLSDSGTVSSSIFTLQPQECRALIVEFKAIQVDAHIGSLRITQRNTRAAKENMKNEPRLLFRAPLHGIGGQSKLVFKDGIFRHAGTQGLPLGSLHESEFTKQIYFTIWNKGGALGFVLFDIDLKWKYRNLGEEVYVTPSKTVIKPGGSVRCAVTVPRRALTLARGKSGDTEAIASLSVLHGDEATRLRIKKIYQNKHKDGNMCEAWDKKCQGKLKPLCSNFPDEDMSYCRVNSFKEPSIVLWSLLDELVQKEVSLTYDLDLDYSVARLSSDLDETLHFQTVSEDLLNSTLIADPHK